MELAFIDAKLGKTFADRFREHVIDLDDVQYTRHDVIRDLQCANLNAAAMLNRSLRRLRIKTIAQLAKLDPTDLYRVHRVGDTQVYVAMCLLEKNGVNISKWWGWDVKGGALKDKAKKKKAKSGAQDTPTPARVSIR